MRKKILALFVLVIVVSSTSVYAGGSEFMGKIGTAYGDKPGKFGLDVSLNYIYDFDPYFVFGFEADFYWLSFEEVVGQNDTGGGVMEDVMKSNNLYTFPVYFNVQVRLPFLVKHIFVEPALTIGLGYSFMILNYSQPQYTDDTPTTYAARDNVDFYHGFAWQVIPSVSFKPSEESNVAFVADIGYRGMYPSKGNSEMSLSGMLFRVGVKFKI